MTGLSTGLREGAQCRAHEQAQQLDARLAVDIFGFKPVCLSSICSRAHHDAHKSTHLLMLRTFLDHSIH
jgi:hypothetical protein